MKRGLIYTAIIGDRDKPLRIRAPESNVDYLMFTDRTAPKGWQEVRVPSSPNPRLAARMLKVALPPQAEDYDWALWIDGSHIPQRPIAAHVANWLTGKAFAAYKHHHWDCTYKEIAKCIEFRKDTTEKLNAAADRLKKACFPEHYGMLATTILARRVGSTLVDAHSKLWQAAIEQISVRDQVSFMSILWSITDHAPAEDNLHWIGPNAFRNDLFHYQGGH